VLERLIVTASIVYIAATSITAAHAFQATPVASTAKGVYTLAQAERGQADYLKYCASCHREDLSGFSTIPPLTGDMFMETWAGRTADDLFTYIRSSMPPYRSVAISRQSYADVVAFVFKSNSMPPGSDELTPDSTLLGAVTIAKSDSR
jgi:mono/diheme cytochrome c family protein